MTSPTEAVQLVVDAIRMEPLPDPIAITWPLEDDMRPIVQTRWDDTDAWAKALWEVSDMTTTAGQPAWQHRTVIGNLPSGGRIIVRSATRLVQPNHHNSKELNHVQAR